MKERLNKKRIYPNRSKEVSKTEADRFMGNRLSNEQLEKIKKLQEQWEKDNSHICKCKKMICAYCGGVRN